MTKSLPVVTAFKVKTFAGFRDRCGQNVSSRSCTRYITDVRWQIRLSMEPIRDGSAERIPEPSFELFFR